MWVRILSISLYTAIISSIILVLEHFREKRAKKLRGLE